MLEARDLPMSWCRGQSLPWPVFSPVCATSSWKVAQPVLCLAARPLGRGGRAGVPMTSSGRD